MPFLSLLSNPSNNVSIAGRAKYGVSAGAQYSFVPSPFGPLTNTNIPAVPTSISEDSLSNNASTFMFYVNGINAQGKLLYWNIKHITTNSADFYDNYGSFYSDNWRNSYATSLSNSYAHQYGEELGRFSVVAKPDLTTEGSETFQVEVREGSLFGPVVLTSSVITLSDTSVSPTFSFPGIWNGFNYFNYYLQNGLNEWQSYEIQFKATNIPTTVETYLYYTFSGTGSSDADIYYFGYNRYQDAILPQGQVYVYNDQYWDGSTFQNYNTGWGRFYVAPRNDRIREGPETLQIHLRTGSRTGPIVASSPVFTINDTSVS